MLYIKKHLEFIDSEEYQDIRDEDSNMAAFMSEAYEESGPFYVNEFWSIGSGLGLILGDGDMEKGREVAEQYFLKSKYDVLITGMMSSTAAKEAFAHSEAEGKLSVWVHLAEALKDLLEYPESALGNISEAELGEIRILLEAIDEFLGKCEDGKGFYDDAIGSIRSEMQEINQTFPGLADKIKSKLTLAKNVLNFLDVAGMTALQVMDAYAVYNGFLQASSLWSSSWRKIQKNAEESEEAEGREIADSIRRILKRVEDMRESRARFLAEQVVMKGGANVLTAGLEAAYDGLTDYLALGWPYLKLYLASAAAGIKLGNLVTGMDEIAYRGNLLYLHGQIAQYVRQPMLDAEKDFLEDPDFDTATVFDQAFHLYKEMQLEAADLGISYFQAYTTGIMDDILLHTADEAIAQANIILAKKADWQQLECHEFSYDALNNGGNVVKYLGRTYYWAFGPDAFAADGYGGSFFQNGTAVNQLTRCLEDGTQTVLYADTARGPIYVCGEYILYPKNTWDLGCVRLDGQDPRERKGFWILASDCRRGLVIGTDIEDGHKLKALRPAETLDDSRSTVLAGEDAMFIAYDDGWVYYVDAAGNQADIYRVSPLGRTGDASGSAEHLDNCLYMNFGYTSGNGLFFSGGVISRIRLDTKPELETVTDFASEGLINAREEIYAYSDPETGEDMVLFFPGEPVSRHDYWYNSRANRGNLVTEAGSFTAAASDLPLAALHGAVIRDGCVYTYLRTDGTVAEVLSREEAAEKGYAFSDPIDGWYAFVTSMDVVGDEVWYVISRLKEGTMYMRGEKEVLRDPFCLYRKNMVTGEVQCMNTY